MTKIDALKIIARALCVDDDVDPDAVDYDRTGAARPNWHCVQGTADAILTALEAKGLVIEQGWQPIETAPKDGRAMQLFIPDCGPDGKGVIASPRSQTDDGSWWDDELEEEIGWTSATHWRPLPEPPLAARGE